MLWTPLIVVVHLGLSDPPVPYGGGVDDDNLPVDTDLSLVLRVDAVCPVVVVVVRGQALVSDLDLDAVSYVRLDVNDEPVYSVDRLLKFVGSWLI